MGKLKASCLIFFRNMSWKWRYMMDGDSFEHERTDDYCGVFSLKDIGMTEEEFLNMFATYEIGGVLPLRDCVLQYEEHGQICSFHWKFPGVEQLHMRFFRDDRGDFNRGKEYIIVHSHSEIQPEADPIAHIRGYGFAPECMYVLRLIEDTDRKV